MFHHEFLEKGDDFKFLQELDFGYNLVQDEDHLWYTTQMRSLQILVITGNPFATLTKAQYAKLEDEL